MAPSIGMSYDYSDPYFDTFVGGYSRPQTTVQQITEGKLNIDFVDAHSSTLAWNGMAKGRVTDKDARNLEKTVKDTVEAIMKSFPVIPGA